MTFSDGSELTILKTENLFPRTEFFTQTNLGTETDKTFSLQEAGVTEYADYPNTENEQPQNEWDSLLETTDVPHIPSQHLMSSLTEQAPELLDVLKEVKTLDQLRERIEEHNNQRSATEAKNAARRVRQKLASRFEGGFRAYDDFEILQVVEEKVVECYPVENFNLDMAKELRSISKEIASLYERYQKIIKGTSLFIEFDSDQFDMLLGIIFECCPPDIQLRIADRLDKHGVKVGGNKQVRM